MRWGAAPELIGPRHQFRVALMARTLARHLAARPHGGSAPVRVLDAGAGRGTLAWALAEHGYAVTALEESSEFLSYLSQRADCRSSLELVRADVAALPFANAAFNGAVCGEVLEHVGDDGAAVAGLARVLRPG